MKPRFVCLRGGECDIARCAVRNGEVSSPPPRMNERGNNRRGGVSTVQRGVPWNKLY